jgi:universal stress protein A
MIYRNVLVCLDLRSREASALVQRAAELAAADGAVTALSVIELGTFDDARDAVGSLVEDEYWSRSAHLERLCAAAGQPQADRRVVVGRAASQIAEFAREHGCDLVVLGEHGEDGAGARRRPLGSTADAVLKRLDCDALVVKAAKAQP